jgi:outer membrane protein OmpA-like peptidoglycan-associated protein
LTPAAGANPVPLERSQRANVPPPRFEQLQQSRTSRTEAGGRRTVIQEGPGRTIIKQDNRVFIRHNDSDRFKRFQNSRSIPLSNGGSQTFYVRPDGVRVVSEVDRNGGLIRRYRRDVDGRERNLIDNRRFWRNAAIGVGVGAIGAAIILNLRSPVVSIPRERYIVDYGRVSDDDLYETLNAPPVERLDRAYSMEEVRYNYPLRERMRSVDLDDINFEFGATEVTPDQYGKLERLARVINRVLKSNPDEVFLIEGHTDAVGDEVDNASLSDRRAQSVAQILSEEFSVPPENLVTQGYGEQFLKVNTREAERSNRRVTARRVTPLLDQQ